MDEKAARFTNNRAPILSFYCVELLVPSDATSVFSWIILAIGKVPSAKQDVNNNERDRTDTCERRVKALVCAQNFPIAMRHLAGFQVLFKCSDGTDHGLFSCHLLPVKQRWRILRYLENCCGHISRRKEAETHRSCRTWSFITHRNKFIGRRILLLGRRIRLPLGNQRSF